MERRYEKKRAVYYTALQDFQLRSPLRLAVPDSIRYCHIWNMGSLTTDYFYALNCYFFDKVGVFLDRLL